MKSYYFLKKDLRLRDNKALQRACEDSSELNIVYPLDESFLELSPAQRQFIFESLQDLNSSLKSLKTRLLVFKGSPVHLIAQTESLDKVFFSKVYNSKDQETLLEAKVKCAEKKVEFLEIQNTCLYEKKGLPFKLDKMPKVFTNFRKEIEKLDLEITSIEPPQSIPKAFESKAVDFEEMEDWSLGDVQNSDFNGGETEGQKRLEHYLWNTDAVKSYKETRNGMVAFDDSTKFSPWLAVGALSPRDIMVQIKTYEDERGANESTYWVYFELLWREYFKLYSLKFGKLIFELEGIGQKKIELSDDQDELFESWSRGSTGNDFIDANMTELKTTGWMSNRGRQNVASYLSKEIFVDWRWGAQWFAENLIDYDIESNWGNWNYVAGVGVDPRDRKFNIKRQADTYDPAGEYVKKFLDRQ